MPRPSFFELLSGYTKSGIKEDEKNFISSIVTLLSAILVAITIFRSFTAVFFNAFCCFS